MDSHNDLLGELAADAALERSDFIVQATEQLRKFLDHHKDRIAVVGGLTLIDDEPDYLSIAPEGLREAFITGGLSPIGRPVDDIPFDELNLALARDAIPLESPVSLAGVSSFGFGGTNGALLFRRWEE